MYHYLHALDTMRLVISNDGWAMTETDICAIHNCMHGQENEVQKYEYFKETLSSRENLVKHPSTAWSIFAKAFDYQDQSGWGYTSVGSADDFVSDYGRIMGAVYSSKGLWSYCYTQITDVEQEINDLLTYDRHPKCDLSKIKKINDAFHVMSVV